MRPFWAVKLPGEDPDEPVSPESVTDSDDIGSEGVLQGEIQFNLLNLGVIVVVACLSQITTIYCLATCKHMKRRMKLKAALAWRWMRKCCKKPPQPQDQARDNRQDS
ncbi:Oidioi.mRNA.OKI2018_I69.chr1.g2571.t1.cds [Oikopleura dioica]|uniref:Oidioi.mRNA.OKI2018_I69.chr1.g2571.t1.cds n=1 Tax=Oikopleura dioica TaxID=34765 RepID=A0ABN7SRG5_OIKDI|nr:Oidioi.mRNA.OKI2018_I69.chr1.g2571.t1.cds [Oikopleura dioica]